MTRRKIEDFINNILVTQFEIDAGIIKSSASLRSDLKLVDSDISDIAMDLEDEYNIGIPEVEEDRWRTVKNIVDYIETKIK